MSQEAEEEGGPGRGGDTPSLLARPRLGRAPPRPVLPPCCWGCKSAPAQGAACSRVVREAQPRNTGEGHPAHPPQPAAPPAPAGLRVLGDSPTPAWVLAPLLGEKPLSLRAQSWRRSVFSRKPEAFAPKDPGLCREHGQSHGGDVGVSWKPSPSSVSSWFGGRTLISSRTLKCLILHCF